jgi:hypothetical protein
MVVELREAAEAGFFGLVWDHYLCCRKGMLNGGRAWVQLTEWDASNAEEWG